MTYNVFSGTLNLTQPTLLLNLEMHYDKALYKFTLLYFQKDVSLSS